MDLQSSGYRVVGIVRKQSNVSTLGNLTKNVELYSYDGSVDKLCSIFLESKPEVVVHLATYYVSEHGESDIDKLIESNVLFGTHLLEAMSQTNISKLINVGTTWQYYKGNTYNPVNIYAATKQAFSDIILYYTETGIIDAITLLLTDTYGPQDKRKKLVPILIDAAKSGIELGLSPGEQEIDLIHINDVISAFRFTIEKILSGNFKGFLEYFVSGSQPCTIKQLVSIIESVSCKKIKANWSMMPYRKREVMKANIQTTILPGWEPKISLKDGLKSYWDVIDKDFNK